MAVNLVGLFVHNLMEESQRRAFLDTRNCIAARLEMEDENEKLVRKHTTISRWTLFGTYHLLLGVCLGNIVMERSEQSAY